MLQGWPQSPRADFPYVTEVDGNTITLTFTEDWPAPAPGPKSVHLALLNSTNPNRPGRYSVDLSIKPDPLSDALEGHGHIKIISKVRPSVNVVSLFWNDGDPTMAGPPPLPNPLYQDLNLGDDGLLVGMYLWERGGAAALGVDIAMTSPRHGRLVQDGRTVGQIRIKAPKDASNHTLVSMGASVQIPAFVTSQLTGLLLTQFTPDVAGHYQVTFRMNGGNSQTMHYDVSD